MKTITLKIQPVADACFYPGKRVPARLLVPSSFCDGYEECVSIRKVNASEGDEVLCDYGMQTAELLIADNADQPIIIQYQFNPATTSLPEGFFAGQVNRYTSASVELDREVKQLAETNTTNNYTVRSEKKLVFELIKHAKTKFSYGHVDRRFNDGLEVVPSVCGTTKGSCVDINTYLIAAAKSLGIAVQYVAGYWFHPDRTFTHDMHCWLLFYLDGEIVPWDLAHHLKWGVDDLAAELNPAGGRRVPMSFGRGLNYDTTYGMIQISHFSEPVWVFPDGKWHKSDLEITIEENLHCAIGNHYG